tara:strand:+ start:4396 stop:4869 length:474 start_codon:yes stop_codon:yes gene_type:complete
MKAIDETQLKEDGWHGGTLKYVKLISFPDAADVVSLEPCTYTLEDLLSESEGYLGPFEGPRLHSDSLDTGISLFLWHRIKVHGQKYIAVVGISDETPFSESDILIHAPGDDYSGMLIKAELKVTYKAESGVLLPVGFPNGAWIEAAVSGVKTELKWP